MFSTPLEVEPPTPALWTIRSVRFQMVLLIGCSTMVFGLIRGSMSMAIVCMVDQAPGLLSDEINLNGSNLQSDDVQNNVQMYTTTYQVNWSVDEQAKIHTSYYIGALVAVFAADNLIRRFGAKHVLSFGLILNILGSFSTPVIAIHFSYIFVIALRALIGFGSGFLIPCGSVIISRWFPISEKSTAMAIFTTGNQIGIAGAMILTAKICQINVLGGWPLSFTLYGVIGLAFLFLWELRASDKPRNSKYMTASELEYIRGKKAKRSRTNTVISPTPYRKILLSPCVLAICVCSFAQSFVLVGLITYLPRYNQLALQMNISSNGIWSAIPFFVQMITKLFCGAIADFIKKQRVSATIVTKVFNGIASFGTAGCIVLISMLHSDTSLLVTILMCSSMGFFSGYVSGYNTSIVSVAPQFTAFISSYSQIYAKAASTLAPFLMGLMTQKGTVEEWKYVFYMLAFVLISSGVFFQIFGHGKSEAWGETPSRNPSIHYTSFSEDAYVERKIQEIERHNSKLFVDCSKDETKKRVAEVSFMDDDVVIPLRLEDLDNDFIEEEDPANPRTTSVDD